MRKPTRILFIIIPLCLLLYIIVLAGRVAYPIEIGSLGGNNGGGASYNTVSQSEAEAGTSTTIRNWTAQRVSQAISALGALIGNMLKSVYDTNANNIVDNAEGLSGTTFTPTDSVIFNMPADKSFTVNLSGNSGLKIGNATVRSDYDQIYSFTLTGTSSESTIMQSTIKANSLGTTGAVWISYVGSCTAGSGNRVTRLYYGGSLVWQNTVSVATGSFGGLIGFANLGSSTSQGSLAMNQTYGISPSAGVAGNAPLMISVNSTIDQTVKFTYQPAVATETVFFHRVGISK